MKPDVEAHLINLENSLLHESVRKSNQLEELLADDYVEIGSSGRSYTKDQVMALLWDEPRRNIQASDFKAHEFAPGNVLISYRTIQDDVHSLRTSLWQLRGDRWQLAFHQGTIVND
ncbi:MAG TPA: DUF4440 domain-containing protein [Methylophilaceae bacterium]|jgi:hypothetical protein